LSEFLKNGWFSGLPHFTKPVGPSFVENYSSFHQMKFPETVSEMVHKYNTTVNNLLKYGVDLVVVTHGYGVQFITEGFCEKEMITQTPYCCITNLVQLEGLWKAQFVADASHWKST